MSNPGWPSKTPDDPNIIFLDEKKRLIVLDGGAFYYIPPEPFDSKVFVRYLKIQFKIWKLRFDRWHGLIPSLRVYDKKE